MHHPHTARMVESIKMKATRSLSTRVLKSGAGVIHNSLFGKQFQTGAFAKLNETGQAVQRLVISNSGLTLTRVSRHWRGCFERRLNRMWQTPDEGALPLRRLFRGSAPEPPPR